MWFTQKLGTGVFCCISDGIGDHYWRGIAHRVKSRNELKVGLHEELVKNLQEIPYLTIEVATKLL